jgi:hypothetical protein
MFKESFSNTISKLVFILGVVFLLIGIIGFVNNPVLGLFEVDTLHNIVHLGSGLALVLSSGNPVNAKRAALGVGIVYGLVTLLGFIMIGASGEDELLGLMKINGKDNFLHLFLTAVLIGVGLMPLNQNKGTSTRM